MKFNKNQKYETPCAQMAQMESEGLFCHSIVMRVNVDDAHNIAAESSDSPYAEQSYFEF